MMPQSMSKADVSACKLLQATMLWCLKSYILEAILLASMMGIMPHRAQQH